MTRFASETVVRCPSCRKLAIKQHLAGVSGWDLASPYMMALARSEVSCPHCRAVLTGQALQPIIKLDTSWKRAIWLGIKRLNPIVTTSEENNSCSHNSDMFFVLKGRDKT